MMNHLGLDLPDFDIETMLTEIADVVPFFAGVKWHELGDNGKQWPVLPDGTDTQMLHIDGFKRGKGKFHFYEYEQSNEITTHQHNYPFILTTGRDLVHYNAGTMTRRTANEQILTEDILLVSATDAKTKGITDNGTVRLFSDRGEINLKAQISNRVKPGVLYTTFHFPEFMVNRVTSDEADSETMCPEYKVVSVDFEAVEEAVVV